MFARMTVSRQLKLAFGLISLITLIAAAIIWRNVNSIDQNLEHIAHRLVPQVEAVRDLEVTIIRASLETRHAMLMRTAAQRDATLAEIGRLRNEAEELIRHIEANLKSEEGRKRLGEIKRTKELFWRTASDIVPLIVAEKQDEAVEMLITRVIPARNEFLKAIKLQSDWQKELLRTENAAALASGTWTEWLVMIVAVLTAAIGLAMAIGFSRHLARQLGGEPHEAVNSVRAIAAGDLARPVPVRLGDTRSVMAALAEMRQGLTQLVSQVRQGVDNVATASSQIASGNADLSARTEQQAGNVQHTANTMQEITQTVRMGADSAHQANQMAAAASASAEQGGAVVSQVVATMGEIQGSSQRISDIIGTIDSIAFQTNILALNAAVEAARAGEAGRGFAVVAAEVRALAQRSADAAREIKQLISDSVDKVNQGDLLVKDAGQRMEQIVEQVRQVSGLLGEMSATSEQQTRNISSVGEAVTQIDQSTQQNAALVEQSAAAADSLKQQASQLAQAVAVFRIA